MTNKNKRTKRTVPNKAARATDHATCQHCQRLPCIASRHQELYSTRMWTTDMANIHNVWHLQRVAFRHWHGLYGGHGRDWAYYFNEAPDCVFPAILPVLNSWACPLCNKRPCCAYDTYFEDSTTSDATLLKLAAQHYYRKFWDTTVNPTDNAVNEWNLPECVRMKLAYEEAHRLPGHMHIATSDEYKGGPNHDEEDGDLPVRFTRQF